MTQINASTPIELLASALAFVANNTADLDYDTDEAHLLLEDVFGLGVDDEMANVSYGRLRDIYQRASAVTGMIERQGGGREVMIDLEDGTITINGSTVSSIGDNSELTDLLKRAYEVLERVRADNTQLKEDVNDLLVIKTGLEENIADLETELKTLEEELSDAEEEIAELKGETPKPAAPDVAFVPEGNKSQRSAEAVATDQFEETLEQIAAFLGLRIVPASAGTVGRIRI